MAIVVLPASAVGAAKVTLGVKPVSANAATMSRPAMRDATETRLMPPPQYLPVPIGLPGALAGRDEQGRLPSIGRAAVSPSVGCLSTGAGAPSRPREGGAGWWPRPDLSGLGAPAGGAAVAVLYSLNEYPPKMLHSGVTKMGQFV